MPGKGQHRILAAHGLTVIANDDPLAASGPEQNGDARGAGVDRVLDQLLDDRCRSLDDFTRGDLIRHRDGQNRDTMHA